MPYLDNRTLSERATTFLKDNLPEAFASETLSEVLDKLYDWIDDHGFGMDSLYNEDGKLAQWVYDELFFDR